MVDLNYAEIRNGRLKRYQSAEIYENVHAMDLMQISEVIPASLLRKNGDSNAMSFLNLVRTG